MKYSKLYEGSICERCVGCNKLGVENFKGIPPSKNKEHIPCKNFVKCYSDEEIAEKLRENNN